MRHFLLVTAPRLVLGLLFSVSAVDGFWWLASGQHLIHPPVTEQGRVFEAALQNSGFFWPMLKTVNLLGALSLLLNIVPAFGLALLAPVMAVIVAFHLTINTVGIPVALILVLCGGLLAYAYRDRYAGMFR
ncbi:hypothetical protein ASG72_16315 [Bosea sp. Leaf344]|uniref:hypothetical protein n=1 Tax=Bosea sp. Leaf344 TaxID=1736346 RepID=UPI0006FE7516|nr:hypothetical protein [Bosea sp. Leaf344]KQU51310.1 hypothetical protein ASG72_16315 [Bosea sp. Leaf344]